VHACTLLACTYTRITKTHTHIHARTHACTHTYIHSMKTCYPRASLQFAWRIVQVRSRLRSYSFWCSTLFSRRVRPIDMLEMHVFSPVRRFCRLVCPLLCFMWVKDEGVACYRVLTPTASTWTSFFSLRFHLQAFLRHTKSPKAPHRLCKVSWVVGLDMGHITREHVLPIVFQGTWVIKI